MKIPVVRFSRDTSGFAKVLRERVETYFETTGKKKSGGFKMYLKSAIMLSLYFVPWALITFGLAGTGIWFWLAEILMGLGLAGIGLNIMHDGNHNSYSSKSWVNTLMGRTIDLVGGNADMWKIQHNVLHHTFTNISGLDEDINPVGVMRFSPDAPYKPIYKYQHIYAWFFYSLMTLLWMLPKDWTALYRYGKKDLIKTTGKTSKGLFFYMLTTKAVYFTYSLILPMIFSGAAWWMVILGWVVMHLIAGLTLAIIFQPAHVLEHNTFEKATEKGIQIDASRLEHQLMTTANFGTKNRLIAYFFGGLNFQIEHHLFPNICHVHYSAISKIVRETAKEFNLPYRSDISFAKAVQLHGEFLKNLGKKPNTITHAV